MSCVRSTASERPTTCLWCVWTTRPRVTTYVLGTDSVHRSAELCDYLQERIDADDVVHAVNSRGGGEKTDAEAVRDGEDALNAVRSRLGAFCTVETHQFARGDDPATDLIQCVEDADADELVVGLENRDPTVAFGRTVRGVLRDANVPVAVVPLETAE